MTEVPRRSPAPEKSSAGQPASVPVGQTTGSEITFPDQPQKGAPQDTLIGISYSESKTWSELRTRAELTGFTTALSTYLADDTRREHMGTFISQVLPSGSRVNDLSLTEDRSVQLKIQVNEAQELSGEETYVFDPTNNHMFATEANGTLKDASTFPLVIMIRAFEGEYDRVITADDSQTNRRDIQDLHEVFYAYRRLTQRHPQLADAFLLLVRPAKAVEKLAYIQAKK